MLRLLMLVVSLLLVGGAAEAGRLAFIDPVTVEMKSHVYVTQNQPGDGVVAVPDDFALVPGRWRWTGAVWIPYVLPPTPEERRRTALEAHVQSLLADPATPQRLKDVIQGLMERGR
mgnify:CR=1 FL=1